MDNLPSPSSFQRDPFWRDNARKAWVKDIGEFRAARLKFVEVIMALKPGEMTTADYKRMEDMWADFLPLADAIAYDDRDEDGEINF